VLLFTYQNPVPVTVLSLSSACVCMYASVSVGQQSSVSGEGHLRVVARVRPVKAVWRKTLPSQAHHRSHLLTIITSLAVGCPAGCICITDTQDVITGYYDRRVTCGLCGDCIACAEVMYAITRRWVCDASLALTRHRLLSHGG
jgi:hypothetical protein